MNEFLPHRPTLRQPICLSKLSIVGLLGPNTPIPIVEEIALSHGIRVESDKLKNNQYFLQMIQRIHITPVETVMKPFSRQDYHLIGRFINPYLDPKVWPELASSRHMIYPRPRQTNLSSSLTRYFRFRSWSGFESMDLNFKLSPITPDSPNNIDACILFRYCTLRGLNVNRTTSLDEMDTMVRMDRQGDTFFLRQQIINALSSRDLSRRSLINSLHSLVGSSISKQSTEKLIRPKSRPRSYSQHRRPIRTKKRERIVISEIKIAVESDNPPTDNPAPPILIRDPPKRSRLPDLPDEKPISATCRINAKNSQPAKDIPNKKPRVDSEIIPWVPLFSIDDNQKVDYQPIESRLTQINNLVLSSQVGVDRNMGIPMTEIEISQAVHERFKKLKPTDHIKAIILAAVLYQLDISSCRNPLLELKSVMDYQGDIIHYQPTDESLFEKIQPDRIEIDGPIISIIFNPRFPRSLYDSNTLKTLALSYGYTEDDISVDDPYYLLQMAILTDHFYQGKPINLLNKTTPIELDSIDELRLWEYVSYGNMNGGYQIIKYTELDNLFRISGYFRYPKANQDDPETYSTESINRLMILLLRPSYSGETCDHLTLRHNLALEINRIIQEDKVILPAERNLRDMYRQNPDNQRIIKRLMAKFLDITMKMRGWPVVDKDGSPVPYPIIKTPVDNPFEVQVRVTQAIGTFDRYCGENEKCAEVFLKYPLFTYRGGYVRSKAIDDGFTIQDRLNIVKADESITACIRLTSNWFAATYSKISQVLGIKQVFQIEQVRSIG